MVLLRLLLGLTKGAVVGGALGYGAFALGLGSGFGYVLYGVVGVAVGLVVGRPVWSHLRDRGSTIWVSVLKALVGFGVGAGLYAIGSRVGSGFELTVAGETRELLEFPFVLGGAIGAVYGGFVEVDDAPSKRSSGAEQPSRPE